VYDTPGLPINVCVTETFAYTADFTSGLYVIDVSVPSAPSLAGAYLTPGFSKEIAADSNAFIYIADFSSLRIFERIE
jgi:hypothetical protein